MHCPSGLAGRRGVETVILTTSCFGRISISLQHSTYKISRSKHHTSISGVKMRAPTARAHWLNADRTFGYAKVFMAWYILVFIGIVVLSKNGLMPKPEGMPVGTDFIAFWGASYLALHGHAADAYELANLFAAQQVAVPASTAVYAWSYPPTFYLAVLPLALMPYLTAYGVFMATTFPAFLAAMRRAVPYPRAWLLVFAFPAVAINLGHGQNGFLTAALAGFAMALLDRRPVVAGVLIGLLSIKPHLAVLFPVALLVSRRWAAFAAAAGTVAGFLAICLGVFGPGVFEAFMRSAGFTQAALESGVLPWTKMTTFFAGMRMIGTPIAAAYAVHIAVAILAIAATAYAWAKDAPERLRASMLFVATFLISPYAYWYDLVWLAFPIAWMASEALQTGWRRGEREILFVAWLMPLLSPLTAMALGVPVGAIVLLCFAGVVLQRIRQP